MQKNAKKKWKKIKKTKWGKTLKNWLKFNRIKVDYIDCMQTAEKPTWWVGLHHWNRSKISNVAKFGVAFFYPYIRFWPKIIVQCCWPENHKYHGWTIRFSILTIETETSNWDSNLEMKCQKNRNWTRIEWNPNPLYNPTRQQSRSFYNT